MGGEMYKRYLHGILAIAIGAYCTPAVGDSPDSADILMVAGLRHVELTHIGTAGKPNLADCIYTNAALCADNAADKKRAAVLSDRHTNRISRSITSLPALEVNEPAAVAHNGILILDEHTFDAKLDFSRSSDILAGHLNGAREQQARNIELTSSFSGQGALTEEGASTVNLNAATALGGVTDINFGRLAFNGGLSAGTGLNAKRVTAADNVNPLINATPDNNNGLLIGSSPGIFEITGDLALTNGSTYLFGMDGYGTANSAVAGIAGDSEVLAVSDTVDESEITGTYETLIQSKSGPLPETSSFNTVYGTNSIVLSLTPGRAGLNTAMYGGINSASAGYGHDISRSGSAARADIYGFLNGFNGISADAAAKLFSMDTSDMEHQVLMANRLTNRLMRRNVLAHARQNETRPDAEANARPLQTNIWLEITGSRADVDANTWSAVHDNTSMAYYGGIDTQTPLLDRIGVSLGYTTTSISTGLGASAATDNYHALMYAYDKYHDYDVSLVAGTAWGEYRTIGMDGLTENADILSGDRREYSVSMDAEVRRSADFRDYTLSGVGGFLTEYSRSFLIDADNPYAPFSGLGLDRKTAQLRLGSELLLSDRFFSNDEIKISTHWHYEMGDDSHIPAGNYMQTASWHGGLGNSVTSGIELSAKYALSISKNSRFSFSYSAVPNSENLSHQALASANIRW